MKVYLVTDEEMYPLHIASTREKAREWIKKTRHHFCEIDVYVVDGDMENET